MAGKKGMETLDLFFNDSYCYRALNSSFKNRKRGQTKTTQALAFPLFHSITTVFALVHPPPLFLSVRP